MLIVDDDPRFGMAVAALLEAAGMVVVGRAEEGSSALALAKALHPDVVTMDVDMPVMDGVEATRQLRVRFPTLPVILVTGSDSSQRIQEALAIGAVTAVAKADVYALLADTIRRVLLSGA